MQVEGTNYICIHIIGCAKFVFTYIDYTCFNPHQGFGFFPFSNVEYNGTLDASETQGSHESASFRDSEIIFYLEDHPG